MLRGRDYKTQFDPKLYLQKYYSRVTGNEDEDSPVRFLLQQRLNFFQKYSCKWNVKTAKLLEFGCGPVICNNISAPQYVQEIVLAAHLESERKELELWKNGREDAHDWSSFFKYVVGNLESTPGESAWRDREALLRSRISITSCDLNQEHPIGIAPEPQPQFSIICTSLCFTVACNTFDEYKQGTKKLGKLLKPGGYLVMFDVERATFYRVGEEKWHDLYITMPQIKEAMEEAGFDILFAERDPSTMQIMQNPIDFDCTSTAFVVGVKVKF